ncbi:hypothetical protein [Streptomyces caniscabiei]|uniref:Uncharacterized protein n=1 Tax=Streptomyces caniscabiei TaxID=2746961 RepID=A0A927LAU7_9ACTN|nr:hypothetical protein [Streptomyces caniscabiei]MBD9729305.1 hypothetical protein [Streptomyces caniscabiei]MDX3514970.1 hypothetical protein [Streptomyces caniscabiei]MDX3724410.1 hypothetical protein [Streptomyces caniscabiei]
MILGEPYVRPERSKKQRIRSASSARPTWRFVGSDGLRRHVWNHAPDTPSARREVRYGMLCTVFWSLITRTSNAGSATATSPTRPCSV